MVRDPAHPASSGKGSSFRVVRFRLLHRGKELPLESGEYVIGRAPGCDVLVEDALVSRRHARLLVNDTTALLEDLRSENGVFVNEQRIRRSVRLVDGDRILVGMEEITFLVGPVDADEASPSGPVEVALPSSAPWRGPQKMVRGAPSTLEADTFQYLGHIAEKMIASKRGGTAERLLRGHLEEVLAAARATGAVPRDVVEAAAINALRLALGLRKPGWIDFVIELHLALRSPPCSAVTATLRAALRVHTDVDRDNWESYEKCLAALMPSMTSECLALARSFLWIEKPWA